eukprot:TRINITY_DN227_c0_g1_i9.p1 TRINITY_DN227_c0_g1~~TRINITY_DN227_c0_g1_i9.p1  ORF type:complete len:249 (+),score=58.19 TRINITY_DN227_c0_g1_i9:1-747(+)
MHVIENAHTGRVIQLLSLDNGRRLVSGGWNDDPTIKVWDTTNEYKCLQTLSGHTDGISSLCILKKNGWLASGSYDKNVKLWDLSKGECVATLKGHNSTVNGLVQLPYHDTLFVSSSEDRTLMIWDASSLRLMMTIEYDYTMRTYVHSMCSLSNVNNPHVDEKDETSLGEEKKHDYIAVGDSIGSISIYDLNPKELPQTDNALEMKKIKPVCTLKAFEEGSVDALCYMAQANRLVSGSSSCACKMWSPA